MKRAILGKVIIFSDLLNRKVEFLSHVRIFRHYISAPILVLGAIEVCLLVIAFFAGNAIRFQWGDAFVIDNKLLVNSFLFAFIMVSCTSAMGIYTEGRRGGSIAMAVRSLVAYCLLGCVALTILYYIFPVLHMGRGVLAISVVIALVLVVFFRWSFFKLVDPKTIGNNVLILGIGQSAKKLAEALQANDSSVANIIGYIRTSSDEEKAVDGGVIQHEKSLIDIAIEHSVSEIIVALDDRRGSGLSRFPLKELFECKIKGIKVTEAITVMERELGIVELSQVRPGWLVFSAGFYNSGFWSGLKRIIDIFIAIVLLLILWPLVLIFAFAIYLETGRPIIYKQTRVGLEGKSFEIYKLRSMVTDAEKNGAQWASANDARVTRIGAIIRNTRIDELPQLINVLRGDMSIVGPRPERPEFVEKLKQDLPYYGERHHVKPGLMGWAQLNYPYGNTAEDAANKLRYDLYYVKNRSLLLDIIIMVQTVQVVLLGTGAH